MYKTESLQKEKKNKKIRTANIFQNTGQIEIMIQSNVR